MLLNEVSSGNHIFSLLFVLTQREKGTSTGSHARHPWPSAGIISVYRLGQLRAELGGWGVHLVQGNCWKSLGSRRHCYPDAAARSNFLYAAHRWQLRCNVLLPTY